MLRPIRNLGGGANAATARAKAEKLARREAVAEMVIAAGHRGINIREIMRTLGMTETPAGDHLRALAKAGRIERSNGGGIGCTWGPPGTRAHHDRLRAKSRAARKKLARAEPEKIKRVWRPAAGAPALMRAGMIPSVFAIGAVA